jgi:hypothetical protein
MTSMTGGPSLRDDTLEGRTECWVGVRGDESLTEDGETSERGGD